jgi:HEPN domain-containing protein
MTNREHIDFLINQAGEDFRAALVLADAGFYGHALFWAHLVLEKFCKALWIFKNQNPVYPYIHNLLRLLKESNVELSNDQIEFYAEMNQFQAQGRYSDELKKMENTVNNELAIQYLENTKKEMKWLLNQMQKNQL